LETWLHWILRIGALWCFVGHGAFGIIGKAGWLPYYRVFGVADSLAWDTMPIIGAVDIAIGILILLRPMRAVLVYAVFWTVLTALLRPLAGQGLWQEVFDRAGNYGLPLVLLLLVGFGNRNVRSWFEHARPLEVTVDLARALSWAMRICIALLLIGHGGFGITHLHDKEWIGYLGSLGVSPDAASPRLIAAIGWFEVCLGLAVLVKPHRGLILFVLAWKIGTELLRPLAGEPMWEFVERGGDFYLPVALLLVLGVLIRDRTGLEEPIRQSPATLVPAAAPGPHTAADHSPSPARPGTPPVRTSEGDRRPTPVAGGQDEETARAAAALVARLATRRSSRPVALISSTTSSGEEPRRRTGCLGM